MRRDDDAHRAIHAREFLDRGDVLDVAHARAAVLRGKDRAQQAELAQFLDGASGNSPASSHFMTLGAISRSANSRTLFFR